MRAVTLWSGRGYVGTSTEVKHVDSGITKHAFFDLLFTYSDPYPLARVDWSTLLATLSENNGQSMVTYRYDYHGLEEVPRLSVLRRPSITRRIPELDLGPASLLVVV
jgi:hypothetical protein